MKANKAILLVLLTSAASIAQAQSLYFPLDGCVTEQTSGETFTLEGVRTLPYMPGVKGEALRLDGYSNYLKADLNYSSISTTAMTFSLWCALETYPMMNVAEAENTPTYSMLAGNLDESAKTGFGIFVNSQGGYQFRCYLKSWLLTCEAKGDKLPSYEWNNLVATLDQANNKIYLYRNGTQVGAAKCPYELAVGSSPFYIGKSPATLMSDCFHINTFSALIDEVKVENKVLTPDELSSLDSQLSSPDLSIPSSFWYSLPGEGWGGAFLRPHFHGMPSHAWTNESHGLTFSDGKYHLFFQKNGNGPYMARLHWGHIVSSDLLTWEEVPAAIAPAESYDIKGCWSGCVFNDGQLTGNLPALLYTAVDNAKATICMARPDDATLYDWQKEASNPLINGRPSGLNDDFRDPYFFRTTEGAYIIVGSNKDGKGTCTLHRYDSSSQSWSNDGSLFYTGNSATTCGTFWEMPNVTKIGDKYLFTCTPLGTSSGVRTIYFVGTIDGKGQFTPDNETPKTVELSGFAQDGYGMLSPTIYQTVDGKTLALGIVPDKLPSKDNYELGYAHCYSLPREWSIDTNGNLVQKPYEGLRSLRQDEGNASGRQIEAFCQFTVGSGKTGVEVLKKGDKSAKIFYNPSDNTLNVDVTTLERRVNDSHLFNGIYSSVLPRAIKTGETLTLDVFLDGSVLDIFVNDQWATSVRVFATDAEANGVELIADNPSDVISYKNWNLVKDGSTGIQSLTPSLTQKERVPSGESVYSLSGMKLHTPAYGVNIIDNKKYIIK